MPSRSPTKRSVLLEPSSIHVFTLNSTKIRPVTVSSPIGRHIFGRSFVSDYICVVPTREDDRVMPTLLTDILERNRTEGDCGTVVQ